MEDFRERLQDFEFTFEPESWAEMSRLLEQQPVADPLVGEMASKSTFLFKFLVLSMLLIGVNGADSDKPGSPIDKTEETPVVRNTSVPERTTRLPEDKVPRKKIAPLPIVAHAATPERPFNSTPAAKGRALESSTAVQPPGFKSAPSAFFRSRPASTSVAVVTALPLPRVMVRSTDSRVTRNILPHGVAKKESSRPPVLVSAAGGMAQRREAGFQTRLKAAYPLSATWAIGAEVGYLRFQPTIPVNPLSAPNTWSQQEGQTFAAHLYRSVLRRERYELRLKAGVGLFLLKTTSKELFGNPGNPFGPAQVNNTTHWGVDAGLDYQWQLGQNPTVGVEAGMTAGTSTLFYSGLMVGWRF